MQPWARLPPYWYGGYVVLFRYAYQFFFILLNWTLVYLHANVDQAGKENSSTKINVRVRQPRLLHGPKKAQVVQIADQRLYEQRYDKH